MWKHYHRLCHRYRYLRDWYGEEPSLQEANQLSNIEFQIGVLWRQLKAAGRVGPMGEQR